MTGVTINKQFTDIFKDGPKLHVPKRVRKGLTRRILDKILEIMKRFWHSLTNKKPSTRFKFTANNIKLTNKSLSRRSIKKEAKLSNTGKIKKVHIQNVKNRDIKPPTDEVLIEFSEFFDNLTKILIEETLLDRVIEPKILEIKEELLEKIRSIRENFPTLMEFLDPIGPILENYSGFLELFNFLEDLAKKMKNGDFDNEIDDISLLIENSFEVDASVFIAKNSKLFTTILSSRVCEIIEKMDFEKTFDEIMINIFNFTDSWICANKIKMEHKNMISNANNDINLRADNEANVARQKKAQTLLKLVEKQGGEDTYLEKEFILAFSNEKACHNVSKAEIERNDQTAKKTYFSKVTSDFIEQILPDVIISYPDGSKKSVHGLFELLAQIEYPDNFLTIGSIMENIFNAVVEESSTIKNKKHFKIYFLAFIKEFLTKNIEKKIEKLIVKQFEDQMLSLCTDSYLDELFADTVLPTIMIKLIESWSNKVFFKNLDNISPQIIDYLHGNITQDDLVDKVIGTLFSLVENEFIDFSFDDNGISFDNYKIMVKPMLDNYFKILLKKFPAGAAFNPTQINKYLTEKRDAATKDVYGNLIMNLVFDIGELGGGYQKAILSVFKSSISKLTSASMQDIDSSYHYIAKKSIDAAKTKFSDTTDLESIIFSEKLDEDLLTKKEKEKKEKLEGQISIISKICHDLIYQNLSSFWGGIILKRATPESDFIERQINELYNRIFSHTQLNESLLFNCLDIALSGLTQSAKLLA